MMAMEGGVSKETYSNEEIVVGVWVDGKPIHQKTVIFVVGSVPNNGNIIILKDGILRSVIVDIQVIVMNGSLYWGNHDSHVAYHNSYGLYIPQSFLKEVSANSTWHCTIKYTKVSD